MPNRERNFGAGEGVEDPLDRPYAKRRSVTHVKGEKNVLLAIKKKGG